MMREAMMLEGALREVRGPQLDGLADMFAQLRDHYADRPDPKLAGLFVALAAACEAEQKRRAGVLADLEADLAGG